MATSAMHQFSTTLTDVTRADRVTNHRHPMIDKPRLA
jgi:hypothetical protein